MVFAICYLVQLPIAIYAWRGMPLRHELAHPFANYRRMAIFMGFVPLAYFSLFVTCVMTGIAFIGMHRRRAVVARHATRPPLPPPLLPPPGAAPPATPPPGGADLVMKPSARATAVLFTGPHPRLWRSIFGVLGAVTVLAARSSPIALLGSAVFWIALGALWNPGRRLVFLSDGTATLYETGRILARRNTRALWHGACTPAELVADDAKNWQRVAVAGTSLWISRMQRRTVREAWTYGTS